MGEEVLSESRKEYIRIQSKVYGKDPTKKITAWHQKVDECAFQMALKDPKVLLLPRQQLIETAQRKAREAGYNFVKGKKPFQGNISTTGITYSKISETIRMKKIAELEDDIKDLNDRLTYKEKQREQATLARNYKLCDQLTDEMRYVKTEKRKAASTLQEWK